MANLNDDREKVMTMAGWLSDLSTRASTMATGLTKDFRKALGGAKTQVKIDDIEGLLGRAREMSPQEELVFEGYDRTSKTDLSITIAEYTQKHEGHLRRYRVLMQGPSKPLQEQWLHIDDIRPLLRTYSPRYRPIQLKSATFSSLYHSPMARIWIAKPSLSERDVQDIKKVVVNMSDGAPWSPVTRQELLQHLQAEFPEKFELMWVMLDTLGLVRFEDPQHWDYDAAGTRAELNEANVTLFYRSPERSLELKPSPYVEASW